MSEGRQQDREARKTYEPPRLRRLGTVTELTLGLPGSHTDVLAAGSA